jgi:hypothetical protein
MTRRDLDRILSESAQAVPPRDGSGIDPAVLQDLEKSVAANLLPVRPLPPRSFFFTAFAGSFVLIVAISVNFMKALAIPLMTPLQLTLILSTLGIGAALLAISLVDQMAPGSRQRLRPEFLLPGVVALLLAVVALLFPFGSEPDFVAHGWTCFRAGFPLALLTAIPIWFLLRKGAVLLPRITGATAGLMAGLAGASVLEVHCVNFSAPHILVWHIGVALTGALCGYAAGAIGETFLARR